MGDYKADQDRLFESLQDLADFREASIKDRVDHAAKELRKWKICETDDEARELAIESLKRFRKIPADYVYPSSS